jgi:hypothetical protein
MADEEAASEYATWAFRYLRLGMLGAVLLLTVSIGLEVVRADCVRGSISAYYHSPVQGVFVGVLVVVGFALVAYQGRSVLEDLFLNIAGMLAPFVAFVPTTSTGCDGDSLASISSDAIRNNVEAYLIAGAIGVAVGFALTIREAGEPSLLRSARSSLVLPWYGNAAVVIVMGVLFIVWYDDYDVHGGSAVAMFAALIVAVACKAVERVHTRDTYFWAYAAIAGLMLVGAGVIVLIGTLAEWRVKVLVLEAWEISLFGLFWLVRTVQNWSHERTRPPLEERPVLPEPTSAQLAS